MHKLITAVMVSLSLLLFSGGVGSALAQDAQESLIVEGEICYKVKKDDGNAERKTDLEVEDEGGGKRIARIRTRKALFVCDRALIDLNALQ